MLFSPHPRAAPTTRDARTSPTASGQASGTSTRCDAQIKATAAIAPNRTKTLISARVSGTCCLPSFKKNEKPSVAQPLRSLYCYCFLHLHLRHSTLDGHQLASFARTGHGAYCRQTLMGGHYGLLGIVCVAHMVSIMHVPKTISGEFESIMIFSSGSASVAYHYRT